MLALELLELAADVLRCLLRRGGHRLAERRVWAWMRGGIGLVCGGGMARGLGALVWDAEAEPLVSSSLRRRMTHRSARSTSKLASATGPERFAPVLVRRGRRAVWSGRQVPTSSAVPSAVGSRENFFGEITKTLKLNETCL